MLVSLVGKTMEKKLVCLLICFLLLLLPSLGVCASLSADSAFQKAQQLYNYENYEEALEAFKDLRPEYPTSSELGYYIGMTYKRMQDYRRAQPYLEKSCRLKPRFDAALPELIELLYQRELFDKAMEWISVAEREFIAPAQIYYLKGMVLLKQGEESLAINAFDNAESLDPSLAQSVAYQKALALSQKKDYASAREQLRSVVVKDPASDLAAFANEYLDALRRVEEVGRKVKGSVSYSVQYDDNVICKPTDSSLASTASGEEDWLHVMTAQAEWALIPSRIRGLGLNAVYSFYGTKHNDIGLYDIQSHDISLQPAFYTEAATFAMPVHYDYVTLNDDPYLDIVGVSALANFADTSERMWRLQMQYDHNDYHWPVTNVDDNRDSHELTLSAGHYWFWDSSGYLNVNYAVNYSAARGRNWDYFGNRLTLTLAVPICKTMQWNFVTDFFRQDFSKTHTTYNEQRKDNVLTVSNLLVKEIFENIQLQLQHTFTYDMSSIGIYKYNKNTYSLGVKYRF